MAGTLVDSDVVIAHLRGMSAARGWLLAERRRARLSISAVSVAEVLGGMRSPERHEVRALLSSFTCLPVAPSTGERAGELRRAYRSSHQRISIADYLIAATAQEHELSLATLNLRHFPMFPGLVRPFSTDVS